MADPADAPYVKDLSMWPLVVWRMNRVLSVSEFHAYTEELEQILARRQRYAQVVVSPGGGSGNALTAETRKLQTQWVKRHFDELETHCAAMAVVVGDMSPVVHFAVSVLMSVIGRSPSPSRIVTNEAEAMRWARARLADRARTA